MAASATEMDDDNFFMSLAFLTSDRSKDPVTQVRKQKRQSSSYFSLYIRFIHLKFFFKMIMTTDDSSLHSLGRCMCGKGRYTNINRIQWDAVGL